MKRLDSEAAAQNCSIIAFPKSTLAFFFFFFKYFLKLLVGKIDSFDAE